MLCPLCRLGERSSRSTEMIVLTMTASAYDKLAVSWDEHTPYGQI